MKLNACILVGLSAIASCSQLAAQDLAQLQATQQAKLDDAVQRLTAQREQIKNRQIPMARELRELENEAGELRGKLDEARKADDSRSLDLQSLRSNVEALRQEYGYVTRSLLSEFNASYESSLSVGELPTYGQEIRELNLLLEKNPKPPYPTPRHLLALSSLIDRGLLAENATRRSTRCRGRLRDSSAPDRSSTSATTSPASSKRPNPCRHVSTPSIQIRRADCEHRPIRRRRAADGPASATPWPFGQPRTACSFTSGGIGLYHRLCGGHHRRHVEVRAT